MSTTSARSINLSTGWLTMLVALTSVLLVACDHHCTERGCSSRLEVRLAYPLTTPGEYEFAIGVQEAGPAACTAIIDSDGQEATIKDFGNGGPCTVITENGEFVGVQLEMTPRSLDVTLRHQGTLLVAQTVTPSYEQYRPNGIGCEPVCQMSEVLVSVPGGE